MVCSYREKRVKIEFWSRRVKASFSPTSRCKHRAPALSLWTPRADAFAARPETLRCRGVNAALHDTCATSRLARGVIQVRKEPKDSPTLLARGQPRPPAPQEPAEAGTLPRRNKTRRAIKTGFTQTLLDSGCSSSAIFQPLHTQQHRFQTYSQGTTEILVQPQTLADTSRGFSVTWSKSCYQVLCSGRDKSFFWNSYSLESLKPNISRPEKLSNNLEVKSPACNFLPKVGEKWQQKWKAHEF